MYRLHHAPDIGVNLKLETSMIGLRLRISKKSETYLVHSWRSATKFQYLSQLSDPGIRDSDASNTLKLLELFPNFFQVLHIMKPWCMDQKQVNVSLWEIGLRISVE